MTDILAYVIVVMGFLSLGYLVGGAILVVFFWVGNLILDLVIQSKVRRQHLRTLAMALRPPEDEE